MQRHTVPRIRRFFRRIKSRPPRSRFSHTQIRGDPIRRYAAMPGGHVRNCRLSIHDRIFQGVRSFGRNPKPSCEKAVPCPHVAPYRRVPTESFRSLSPGRTTAIRLPDTPPAMPAGNRPKTNKVCDGPEPFESNRPSDRLFFATARRPERRRVRSSARPGRRENTPAGRHPGIRDPKPKTAPDVTQNTTYQIFTIQKPTIPGGHSGPCRSIFLSFSTPVVYVNI